MKPPFYRRSPGAFSCKELQNLGNAALLFSTSASMVVLFTANLLQISLVCTLEYGI